MKQICMMMQKSEFDKDSCILHDKSMQKIWMAYINVLRPAANRHWGAGPDADHQRMASELSTMSQDDTGGSARRSKRETIGGFNDAPQYRAPYDQGMSDRMVPFLAAR